MDLRVNQMQNVNQVNQSNKTQETDGTFKFTLVSHIEEQELQARLSVMLEEITQQGEKIKKRMDIKDVRKYRTLIQEFLNEVVTRSHVFSRENSLDRRGRHRVYGIVKMVNETLDELAQELIKDERDAISILGNIDEIRGMLLDLLM